MEKIARFRRSIGRVVTALLVAAATVLGFGAPTYAQTPPDDIAGTGAGLNSLKADVEAWVATYGVPVLIGLLLIGIGVALMIKFGRRTKSVV